MYTYIYILTYIYIYILLYPTKETMESIVNIESRSPMDNGQVFLRLDGHVGTTTWLAGGCFQKKELNTSSIMSYLL